LPSDIPWHTEYQVNNEIQRYVKATKAVKQRIL